MIEKALVARLTGYAGLSALIVARVYSLPAPEGATPPFLTFDLESDLPETTLAAVGDYRFANIGVQVHAASYESAKLVAVQARAALNAWTGVQSWSGGTTTIEGCRVENMSDYYDPVLEYNTVLIDVLVHYRG